MRSFALLLIAFSAVIAVGLSVPLPGKEELAEIEKLLDKAKADRGLEVVKEESIYWPPDQQTPIRGMIPVRLRDETKESETEQQSWGDPGLLLPGQASEFPLTRTTSERSGTKKTAIEEEQEQTFEDLFESLRSGREKTGEKAEKEQWNYSNNLQWEEAEKKADEEQWGGSYSLPPIPRRKQEAAKQQWGSSRPHFNSPRGQNKTLVDYLSGQGDRMRNFLGDQVKRMQDYMDRQRNLTAAYLRYERNRTAEYMRQERNSTQELLRLLGLRPKSSKVEEKEKKGEVEAELWGGPSPSPRLPSTILREATSIRIPTGSQWESKESMEMAMIQGFLRKIAPFILRKLSG